MYNITDSTDDIIGTSAFALNASIGDGSGTDVTYSNVKGTITITSPKAFEIQHRSQVTYGSSGFGVSSDFSIAEVYTQVKITKIP